jgi:hypothetical protein
VVVVEVGAMSPRPRQFTQIAVKSLKSAIKIKTASNYPKQVNPAGREQGLWAGMRGKHRASMGLCL